MRRKDREVTAPAEIEAILQRAQVLRLALHNGDYPYLVPVNFGFRWEGEQLVLFFHSAPEGQKCSLLQKDPRLAFEVDGGHRLLPPDGEEACTASFAYESAVGQGTAALAPEGEKAELLTALLAHYGVTGKRFSPQVLGRTAIYKIYVKNITAKRKNP